MSIVNKEILVIDDDDKLRILVRRVLEAAGAQVLEAESVQQAMSSIKAHAPHAIICDLMMPVETGFDFLEHRRQTAFMQAIPVLVLSALGDSNSIYQAAALGADDYMTKPIVASLLLQKLKKALRDHSLPSYQPEPGKRPKLKATIPASIVMVSEAGFMLDAPAKIAPDTKLQINSRFLDQLGYSQCPLRTGARQSTASSGGRYNNNVVAMGMKEDLAKSIRQTIRMWK